ncbi:Riboflavin synthase-like beta-barrel [Penicillium occitanis (nom. inval.)]|nr:hypothetical protein PENOC_040450 [Penicillium occitanis (nom. inval.)]PCH05313.1 Riboflavin synthase-like beta-barrel [Penicillium occitanis (nom. inval.)]
MPMLPWLTLPVMLHSSRDPGECTMTPEQCAYKQRYWVYWYEADHRYSLPTVALFLVAIALFTVARLIRLFAPRSWTGLSGWTRLMALFRTVCYKRVWFLGSTQSIGALMLASVGVIFFLAMTLTPRPYYWPNTMEISYGNSPPIATRAGFMALACMPFIYMLAVKANPITLLTGISHELLNNWHAWAAWAMFVLALVHTFPFIVYHIRMGDIVEQWNDGGIWVTGVVALLAQAWLTFASIPWLRNRYYEFFKSTHYLAALIFIIFFFFHCDYTLTSWDYFIATAVLYTLSWCYSQCKTYFEYGIGHKARLQRETNDTLKITINTRKAIWTAGQHIYLRFLAGGITHMLTAHPFTICSMPRLELTGKTSTLVFYIRPRGGATKYLMAHAIKHPNVEIPVLMDGPYGGIPSTQLNLSDSSVVVGGGAGAGFTLSVIEHFLQRYTTAQKVERRLKVVVATREPDTRLWYIEALRDISHRYPRFNEAVGGLYIDFHETGQSRPEEKTGSAQLDVEKAMNSKTIQLNNEDSQSDSQNPSVAEAFNVSFHKGRPNLPAIIGTFIAGQEDKTIGLLACGPSSMSHDIGEAAVAAQQQIIKGRIKAREVWYHSEDFSY